MDRDALMEEVVRKMEAILSVPEEPATHQRYVDLRRKLREHLGVVAGALGEADMTYELLLRSGLLPGQRRPSTRD